MNHLKQKECNKTTRLLISSVLEKSLLTFCFLDEYNSQKNYSEFYNTVALIYYSQKGTLTQNMALAILGYDGIVSEFCEL